MRIRVSAFISLLIFLSACNQHNKTTTADILDLKKGNVISCGPPQQEFGSVGFAVSCSPNTKEDFELAIAQLHSFEYDEAEKSFARVLDKDAKCAMAYWGIAMSNYHPLWAPPTKDELEKGAKAISIAKSIGGNTKGENNYINALSVFYKDYATIDHKTRSKNYEGAMETLHLADISNKELTIFYALSLIATANPTDKTYFNQKKAGNLLTALYPQGANHPGIIHYIIHAYDSPELAPLALDAARRYAAVAPSSAHAQHMPSHIFTRLGLWDEDIESNLAAKSSAQCYAEQVGTKEHWSEELHAIDYLVYSYLQKGDNISAKNEVDYVSAMKEVWPVNRTTAYALAAIPSRYALENKLWKEAASITLHPAISDWNKHIWPKAIVYFTRALGAANTGNIAQAKGELKNMGDIYDTLAAQKDDYSANQVLVQIKSAKAWIAFNEKKNTEALQLMKDAVSLEDKTEKAPVTPAEVLPARQLLADMLLQMNRPAEALADYEADLKRHPNRFNSLYGAAFCSEKTGDKTKAATYYKLLSKIADRPGSNRNELKTAKAFML